MRAFDAVVFDLDGTLIDSEPLWESAEIALAAAHGVAWDAADARAFFGKPLRETTAAIIERGAPLTVDDAISAMIDDIASAYRTAIPWMPGADALLRALAAAEVSTAIGTMSFARLTGTVSASAPAGTLRTTVSGDEVSRGKPDPEIFLTAIGRLQTDAARTIVVEDSPTGVRAALASGATVLAVPPDAAAYSDIRGLSDEVNVIPSLEHADLALLDRLAGGDRVDLWESTASTR